MRKNLGVSVLALAMLIAPALWGKSPDWVLKGNYANRIVRVSEVVRTEKADIVKVDTGLESNLRIGAVCSVRRNGENVGNIVLVDSSEGVSVGLALDGAEIRKGDSVHITPSN